MRCKKFLKRKKLPSSGWDEEGGGASGEGASGDGGSTIGVAGAFLFLVFKDVPASFCFLAFFVFLELLGFDGRLAE